MDRWKFCLVVAGVAFAIQWMIGCQPASSSNRTGAGTTAEATETSNGVSAEQILTLMKAVYSTAKNYRDDGVLLLSYRKDGLLTEEPQRWSTTWSADGKLYAEVFGAQLTGDGQRMDCFVYDIDTANLDGQRMVVPYTNGKPPLDKVFRDPIGGVFLGGYSELPLNESDPLLRGKLIPAPLDLLTGQLHCPWLHAPVGLLERQPDEQLGNRDCYVIRSLAIGMGCDLWIDKSTGMLVQMSLPLKLLDPQVMAAPNITDLRILARFVNASVDSAIDSATFELKARKNSTPVRSFVSLPEELPVESIGQVVDNFRLIQPDGKPVDHLYFDGRPTALLWLGGENSYVAIDKMSNLAQQMSVGQCNFGIVYSDDELNDGPGKPHLVRPELTAASATSEVPMFYDRGLTASTEFAIRDIPSVVLLDGDSRVQFATAAISPSWVDDLASAVVRVAHGENLADEMLTQYQSFMTSYKSALIQKDASELLPARLAEKRSTATNVTKPGHGQLPRRQRSAVLVPRLVWSNDQFKQPGNIITTTSRDPSIFAIDGARSIVQLDVAGEIVKRTPLELPDGVGVSRIRISSDNSTRALFSPLGRQAFFFDTQWHLIDTVPNGSDEFEGPITDVDFQGLPDEEVSATVASKTSGLVHLIPGVERPSQIVSHRLNPDSIASGTDSNFAERFFAVDGVLWANTGTLHRPMELVDQPYNFKSVKRVLSDGKRFYVVSGYDSVGWKLLAFPPRSGKPIWKQAIGSQFFESLIDSIAVIDTETNRRPQNQANSVAIAVACREKMIHLLGVDGKWLGDVKVDETPRGVSLLQHSGKIYLLASVANRLECWLLE